MTDIKGIGNRIFLGVMTLQFAGCFLNQSVNSVAARYTSLVSFFTLSFLVFIMLKEQAGEKGIKGIVIAAFKDKEVMLTIVGMVITLLNLIIIRSNKGAFLTAACVLMAFLVMRHFTLSLNESIYACCLGASLLIWWYCTVRWYYNFNMVGMIFMITAIMTLILLEYIKLKGSRYQYLEAVQLVLYATATLLCLLYHARCVLAGMLIMGVIYLLLPVISRSRVVSGLLVFAATIGSLLFSAFYILLDKTGISITILYKDILSGRQDIWGELWSAFAKHPFTGIGSSYQIKSFFIFEVHNGLLDIIIVHGCVVFALVLFLMWRRLTQLLRAFCEYTGNEERVHRLAIAGIFAILFTSFFENFFINSPYLLVMVLLYGITKAERG